MEADNSSPTNRYWLCPLYSFDCDCESIDLAEGIQIKPAPRELKKHIGERTSHLYGRWDDPRVFDWVACLPYRARAIKVIPTEKNIIGNIKIGFEENDRARDLLVDLVTALRLCHQGMVTPGPLIFASIHNSEWSIGGTTVWTHVSETDFLHKEPKYAFCQSDTPQVNELVKHLSKLREVEKLDSIGVTLRRFHSSYHGDLEDRLIDQMIAFESLYIADDKELAYKLSLRTAFFLEGKRKQIFSDVKKAYALRGQIVHGNKKVERTKLEVIVPRTEEYLRQSIRRFLLLLSQGKKLEEIRKLHDENILRMEEP